MGKKTKILHIAVVDATPKEIEQLRDALKTLKEKLPYDIEFLITNDKIQLFDVAHLIKELYVLYTNYKKVKTDIKKENKKRSETNGKN